MFQKCTSTKSHYVSCIKINGVPIIAPLVSVNRKYLYALIVFLDDVFETKRNAIISTTSN